jgi:hypothetical protein
MGKKLDEAYYCLSAEANHHIRLSQARDDAYENGFANGFVEALRIVQAIRDGRIQSASHTVVEKPLTEQVVARPTARRAWGRRGSRR